MTGTFRPYRPSNGTEGDMFMAEWCGNCASADYEGDGCVIQLRALMHKIDDPDYPAEWSLTDGGCPQCTAFCKDQPAEPRCDKTPDMFGSEGGAA
jgi:hypothetical protein